MMSLILLYQTGSRVLGPTYSRSHKIALKAWKRQESAIWAASY
jgi:hypothetical protein